MRNKHDSVYVDTFCVYEDTDRVYVDTLLDLLDSDRSRLILRVTLPLKIIYKSEILLRDLVIAPSSPPLPCIFLRPTPCRRPSKKWNPTIPRSRDGIPLIVLAVCVTLVTKQSLALHRMPQRSPSIKNHKC